jgi:sulfate permease, SulP family
MVLVVAITLILDLAIAVIVGCLLACLVFAWDAGTRLTIRRYVSESGDSAEYTVRGPLYFGSVKPLMEAFFPLDNEGSLINPKRATVDLRETEIYDVRELIV